MPYFVKKVPSGAMLVMHGLSRATTEADVVAFLNQFGFTITEDRVAMGRDGFSALISVSYEDCAALVAGAVGSAKMHERIPSFRIPRTSADRTQT